MDKVEMLAQEHWDGYIKSTGKFRFFSGFTRGYEEALKDFRRKDKLSHELSERNKALCEMIDDADAVLKTQGCDSVLELAREYRNCPDYFEPNLDYKIAETPPPEMPDEV